MQSHKTFRSLIVLMALICTSAFVSSTSADPLPREDVIDVPAVGQGLCVSNLFQTNMVIQRDKPIHVWGWADAGEKVTVKFAGKQGEATAGDDRAWKVTLEAVPVSTTPQSMTITGKDKTITLDNILVGDVWVLGGQSNMEFEIAKVNHGDVEVISANMPTIRILTVPYGEGPEMKKGFARLNEWSGWFGRHFRKGDWDVCTPDTVRDLSAIGYIFVRRLNLATGVPIGVIDASRGGTTVETWTPMPVLRASKSEHIKSMLKEWDDKVAQWDPKKDLENRVEQYRQRVEKLKADDKPIPDNMTEPTDLNPGPIADHNYPSTCYAGMIGPIVGLSVKGAIFHQGYNNALQGYEGALMYRDLFPEMVKAWRDTFNDPDMPFGILSLCTDGTPQTRDDYVEKMLDTGTYIREAQYKTFLDLYNAGDKNIGFASTYDLRRNWYHPQLKIPAGERIACWALATQYGFNRIAWKPPAVVDMQAKDGSITLKYESDVADAEGGAIVGFAIAGEDRKFQPADANYLQTGKDGRGRPQYDRKTLILTSPLVPNPVAYRYAWGRSPLANAQSSLIPLGTQRSDDWPMDDVPLGVLGENPDPNNARANYGTIRRVLREEDARRRLFEAHAYIQAHEPDAQAQ
ncbi:MAG: hypothetical protein GC164_06510 [Phycisphaera sp.]|nr:hypothetical protein [Phycisphaera sp.]